MLALHCPSTAPAACASASSRCICVRVTCSATKHHARRAVVLSGAVFLATGMVVPRAADARDFKEALARKEARKAKLREAAGNIKESGKDQQVFKKGDYSLPDDAHTPNTHTRQNEGARTQENV